jgi:hypothetical protein
MDSFSKYLFLMAARDGRAYALCLLLYAGPLVTFMGVMAARSFGLHDHMAVTIVDPLVLFALGLATLAIGTLTRWQYGVFACMLFFVCSRWQDGLLVATLFGIIVAAMREIYLVVPPALFEQRLRRRPRLV